MHSQVTLRSEIKGILKTTSAKALCIETGIHPTAFSQFINGKRVIMKQAASKYFRPLLSQDAWSRVEAEYDLELSGTQPVVTPVTEVEGKRFQTQDQFQYQANPIHSALIVLMEAKDCDGRPEFFAQKLNISVQEATDCLDRLVRLDLLEHCDGFYSKTGRRCSLFVEDGGRESLVLRRKAVLEALGAANKIERGNDKYPITYCLGDFVAAIDPSDMPQLIEEMQAILKRFDRVTMRSEAKEAYVFSVALAPLARPKNT